MDIYIPRYELTISLLPAAYVCIVIVNISILYVGFFSDDMVLDEVGV